MDSSEKKLSQFIGIEYPGVVENIDNALQSLGGINKISEIYNDENRRMELRFRPTDVYCKPTCGERHNSTSILIKIIKRTKKKKSALDPPVESTYDVNPIGLVHTTFKFENLCDFQYLPFMGKPTEQNNCIYNGLLPSKIISSAWLDGYTPEFLPPATFSRMDTPQDYRYKKDVNESKAQVPEHVICRTRQKRTHYAVFQSFKEEGVPRKPLDMAWTQMKCKVTDMTLYQKLKDEFTGERKIWSKNALRVRLQFNDEVLKYLLPTVAYYFPTGPWKSLWVLYDYDPRKDPNSWVYQTFDFRLRQAGGAKSKVAAKRSLSNYTLPYKNVQNAKKRTSVIRSFQLSKDGDNKFTSTTTKENVELTEDYYLFKPGMIPPFRQMFYQYCDIKVDAIQSLLENSILTGANSVCSKKNGWLPPGVEVKCREILCNVIERTLEQGAKAGEKIFEFDREEMMSNSEAEESLDEEVIEEDASSI